ncbi:RNA 2',3'-cyclic phosphodiesterase [Blastococcus sp. TF02A-30]|uniref:RNA 2',3'-cyclic phosphodiesterase n=1 Tax=Blastococcus sp. TF02A-30 TaxID=2250580 RepID=UPI000DE8F2CD|nr:RNA 2',3'-cyclic phosphodiesterase [Blastococcus sp. TF02A-30]RBY83503.1 RNA 2',3'-cyclic phosphodiesterase [Blastococcus sp. TF02A-30]
MSTARLFFAVDPPAEARAHLAAAVDPLRALPGAPRWTPPDRWHLTLLFLAAVPRALVPELVEAAAPAVAATPPMRLRLASGGRFGSARRPQVAWAGLDGDVVPLTELARRLGVVAGGLGLPVEDRPFRPHLTLGRWRPRQAADGSLTDRLAGYRGPGWVADEVRLWESRLGAESRYERVAAWPLVPRAEEPMPTEPGRKP